MQFSDTTNKSGILQKVEDLLGLPDGAITGDSTLKAYVTSDVNEGYERLAFEIRRAQDDWLWDDTNFTDLPIATKAMTTDRYLALNTTNQIYRINRVDFTYDGTNWVEANPIDLKTKTFGLGDDTDVDEEFTYDEPGYVLISNAIGVYPKASSAQVSAGAMVRIEYARAFDAFATSDTTQEPGFDRAFHDLLPLYASMKRAVQQDHKNGKNLKVLWEEGLRDLRAHYATKNEHSGMVMSAAPGLGNYS